MKKFTKVCFIISAVMFLLCIGCCIAGLVLGGNPVTVAKDALGNAAKAFTSMEEDFDKTYDLEDFELAGEYQAEEIQNLVLDMQIGNVVVQSVSGDACRVWIDENDIDEEQKVQVYDEADTMHIINGGTVFTKDRSTGFSITFSDFFDIFSGEKVKNIGTRVIIEVPQDSLRTLDADIQLGVIKLYDISVPQMDINVEAGVVYGAGNMVGNNVKISTGMGSTTLDNIEGHTVTLDTEMGEIKLQSVKVDEFTASVEMGSLDLKNVQAKETWTDCEMGDINIQFAGEAKDYDIFYDVEMGDIDIADHGVANKNALYQARLDCKMGDINVTFLQNNE